MLKVPDQLTVGFGNHKSTPTVGAHKKSPLPFGSGQFLEQTFRDQYA